MSTRLMGLWFLMDTHDSHEAFGHGTTSISAKTQVNWNYRYAWPAIKDLWASYSCMVNGVYLSVQDRC